jgi:uncharacterized protein YbaR (Trm112 family)
MFSPLLDLVVCPGCSGRLTMENDSFACNSDGCGLCFPPLGRVPCLLPRPGQWLDLWRKQLGLIHAEADRTIATFDAEARKPGLLRTTLQRLREQSELTRKIVAEIDGVLVPAIGQPIAHADPIPGFSPLETLHLLHRDWGWPESDENARALGCVERVLGAPLGRTLVVGAGACRLAYDLHQNHGATMTVAVDIDPLVLLVAEKVVHGDRVVLTEARSNATEITRLSAVRTLEAPSGTVDRFYPLLANGLALPLADESFDTVVTPWFTDLVPPDQRDWVTKVRRLLRDEGRWVNYGPLLYPPSRPAACRFSREELLELVEMAGFEVEKTTSELMPFSLSPLAERGRLEACLAFSARKSSVTNDDSRDPPKFIVLADLPVPDFGGRSLFYHQAATFRAVVELIDGSRSINQIAAAIIARAGTHPAAIVDTIRYCLLEVHPLCKREG